MTSIRPGRLDDYPQLVTYDEFLGDRRLDLQAGLLLIAGTGERSAAGYAGIVPDQFLGCPLLISLCVHPEVRREGVGLALLTHVIQTARFPRLYTSTETSNVTMRALLDKVSATQIGYADQLYMDGSREVLFRLK